MTDEAKTILEAALRLPEAERAALAVVLKDSIGDGAPTDEIESAWLDEVERRREDVRAGRTDLVAWDDVRREMYEMIEQASAAQSRRAEQAVG